MGVIMNHILIRKNIGEYCKFFRINELNLTQFDVAKQLGYSKENISSFENGRNDNVVIFLWYVNKGLFSYIDINMIGEWFA